MSVWPDVAEVQGVLDPNFDRVLFGHGISVNAIERAFG